MSESSVYRNLYLTKYEETQKSHAIGEHLNELQLLDVYITTLINSFKWVKGVPENLPPFMVEEFLQISGKVAFFNDAESSSYKMFPAFPAGNLLENGEYSHYTIIARNGKQWIKPREEIALIYNNSLKIPYYHLAAKMAEDSTFALNCVKTTLRRAMLPPIFGVLNEEQLKKVLEIGDDDTLLKTIAAVYKETTLGQNDIQRFPVFDNRESDVLAQWDVFSRYDRMFYRTFGISTVGIQKNERLTEAESTGEEEMTRYSLFQDMVDRRREGCEEVKKKFGVELDFEINRDKKTVFETTQSNEEKVRLSKIESTKGANIATGEVGENNESNSDE